MGLKVGDRVKVIVRTYCTGQIGRVVGVRRELAVLAVRVGSDKSTTFWKPWELQRICNACHRAEDAHTNAGRCLFGASSWA